MSIKSIRIKNLLSFKDFTINDFADINCIIGKNNVGKSNLLKLINFYYSSLNGESLLPPTLHSNYSNHGEITIYFDTSRLEDVVRSTKGKSDYQKHIYKTMFKSELNQWEYLLIRGKKKKYFSLSLKIHKNNAISWSDNDSDVRAIISRIYPFFSIDTRRLDLYNWQYLWGIVSKLKFLNTKELPREKLVEFIDDNVSKKSNSYKDYVNIISGITNAAPYNYQDLLLNYIKVGLEGHTFNINGFNLDTQSDGTNSHKFIEIFLSLIITLTRREFITPTIFIDEPEIGLHPKRSEELIENLHYLYRSLKKETEAIEFGRYATPYPIIIFSTHSPNILKTVIKSFNKKNEHRIYHFDIVNNTDTQCSIMKSYFDDSRFVNVFNDNEARLFFSDFILFVEGETELELFGNIHLKNRFKVLNKIDVYKTNEVMLKAIKPSNSNVSIPYLVLYDADKMIDVNLNDGAVNFLSKEVDIPLIRDKYKKSFWGSDNYNNRINLNNILTVNGRRNDLSINKTSFEKFDIENLIRRINRVITKSDRLVIASNTIEGYLINENSRNMFIKWLIYMFKDTLTVGPKGDANINIDRYRIAYPNVNLNKCFKAIYNTYHLKSPLSPANSIFCDLIKKEYIQNVAKKFFKCKVSKRDIIIILRLSFEGKTDTLCSKDNKNYLGSIDIKIRDLVTILRSDIVDKLPFGGSKTGGWVTSFLNYSLEEISKESSSEVDFKMKFKRAFPELSSIINEISSSIE